MFNTLKYSRVLEATGVSREQAEAHVQIMAEIVEGDLATKQDLKILENKIEQMESRLIIRLTAILVSVVSLTIALTTFIMKQF